jgi:hypothetical protein
MWINPTTTSNSGLLWNAQKENQYFRLEKHATAGKFLLGKVYGTAMPYRIVLKTKPPSVVAEAEEQDAIREHWIFIETQILNHVSSEESETDIINFLKLKCISLSKAEEIGKEDTLLLKQESFFQKTFNLPEEKLLTSTALSKIT